jgi:hypothetical protein
MCTIFILVPGPDFSAAVTTSEADYHAHPSFGSLKTNNDMIIAPTPAIIPMMIL